jgi:hypothetical protein
VHFEHSRVTAVQLRVARRATKHLGPVEGEILYMVRIETMGEGMADLRFLEAALVMRRRQREEGAVATGELIDRRSRHTSEFRVSRPSQSAHARK